VAPAAPIWLMQVAYRPSRRLPWTVELAFVAAFYLSYELLRAVRHATVTAPTQRAHAIFAFEQSLHVAVERNINVFTTAHAWLATATGYYYATLHFIVTPAILGWLWRQHRDQYASWRTVLALATVAALVTYWLFPVAPPRLALPGFTDTLVDRNIFGAADPHGVQGFVNVYAAMPSLHVGWAFWVALAVFKSRTGLARWLIWAYPAATTVVVMATANHFLLDGAAGAALVTGAYGLDRAWRRVRDRTTVHRLATIPLNPSPVAAAGPGRFLSVGGRLAGGRATTQHGAAEHAVRLAMSGHDANPAVDAGAQPGPAPRRPTASAADDKRAGDGEPHTRVPDPRSGRRRIDYLSLPC